MLLHLLWPGGAVEAEHIDREGLQDRHHRGDVGAHQHRAGGFHRDRHHQGAPLARRAEGLLDALQGCLDLQHVLAGFDDEEIHVTGQQTLRLLAERGLHRVEIDVAERGQLGGGTDRAGHEAGLLRGAVLIGHRSGQFGGPLVEREGLVLEAVFGQHDRGGTEGVGLDYIGPDFQELAMHRLHRIGPGDHKVFVAALQDSAAEILGAQVHLLQRGAGGTVEHQHRPGRIVEAIQETDPAGGGGDDGGGGHQASMRMRVTQCS